MCSFVDVGLISSRKFILLKLPDYFPLYASLTGAFLTFLVLVFHIPTSLLFLSKLSIIYRVNFYLDGLTCFFLFIIFNISFLFLYYQKDLCKNKYFLVSYILSLSLILAGNLYFFTIVLALLFLMNYKNRQRNASLYWLILPCLLGFMSCIPVLMNNQQDLFYIVFSGKTSSLNLNYLIFFLVLPVCCLLGFFDFRGEEKNNLHAIFEDEKIYYTNIFKNLIGFYGLLRIFISFYNYNLSMIFIVLFEFIVVITALKASWFCLKVSNLFNRLRYLFILNNAISIQLIVILFLALYLQKTALLELNYIILFFSLFIQNHGFALVFLLNSLKEKINNSFFIDSLFFLGLLLSGFPPFAGFVLFWGNLQLGISLILNHYLFDMILALFFIGCNAVIYLFSLLGWVNLFLALYKNYNDRLTAIGSYFNFLLGYGKGIRIYLLSLFIFSVCPGIILYWTYGIKNNFPSIGKFHFFSFKSEQLHIAFTPVFSVFIFGMVVYVFFFIKKKYFIVSMDPQNNQFKISDRKKYKNYLDITRFEFGTKTILNVLKDNFSLDIHSYLFLRKKTEYLKIYKTIRLYKKKFNILIWEHEQATLFILILISLLSIGLLV